MATIKIKELPIKKLSGITPEDIMVIEDKVDTKQITVEDLQLFFSSDNKINALKNALTLEIENLNKKFEQEIKKLDREDTEFINKLTTLYDDHENTKARLGNLIEKVIDIENLLNTTIIQVDANKTAITNLQSFTKTIRSDLDKTINDVETHTKEIDLIKNKNKEQDEQITLNKENIEKFKDEYEQKIAELTDEISENKNNAKKYSDQLYDQIMQYIDFYHHYHEDPPNFDDPNWADTKQMNLIYKVGTIYETAIDNFNPKNNLPGTWKYIGDTNVYNTNGDTILVKHTYIRIE